uniref:Serpentine Receptor, class H n=1 Tax=Caenorhabditis tropicalis TaxID=1561998 RepID=A0A1I7T8Z4_9PELO
MNVSCIQHAGLLESPEFLSFGFYVTTIIGTPVHLFGFWCILFKTTDQMKNVKWYLVNLHLSIVLFDYSYGLLTCPFILLPRLAGYPLGILRHFGVETKDQTLLILFMSLCVLCSIVAIFENRFHTVFKNSLWNSWRHLWLVTHYITGMFLLSPFRYLIPEQEKAKHLVFETLPPLPCYIYEAPVFVLSNDYVYIVVASCTFIIFSCFEILVFSSFLVSRTIKQLQNNSISSRTFYMQRKFFFALVIQVGIPFVMLISPMSYAWIAIQFNYYNQKMTNLAVLTGSMHGFVSTIVMLFVHHPYRTAFLNILRSRIKMRSSNRISHRESRYLDKNNEVVGNVRI